MVFSTSIADGFRPYGVTSGDEILWLPGNPGDTYTKNDEVGMGGAVSESSVSDGKEGTLILDSDIDKNPVGTVDKTLICDAASVAFEQGEMAIRTHDPVYDQSGRFGTLIPVRSRVPAGVEIRVAKIASYIDETVVSYSAANRYVEGTTGAGADSRPNAALAVVYEGSGKGEVNIVEAYDHADGTVDKMYTFHRPWIATLDTTTKMLILAGEAAADRGVCLMGRCDRGDSDNLVVNDGADDGDYIVFCDFLRIAEHVMLGQLPVIRREGIYV